VSEPTFTTAATLSEQASGHRLLCTLLQQDNVYQVNTFKQLNKYCATLTLKQEQRHGLAALGLAQSITEPGKTVSAWSASLYGALAELVKQYDELQVRDVGQRQVGQPVRGV